MASTRGKSVTFLLNTKDQKIEALHDIIAKVGGLVGCGRCGRIAFLHIDTIGDPGPEFANSGVISMQVKEM
jgi:hypothetical protein